MMVPQHTVKPQGTAFQISGTLPPDPVWIRKISRGPTQRVAPFMVERFDPPAEPVRSTGASRPTAGWTPQNGHLWLVRGDGGKENRPGGVAAGP
jgi:hypothetical protein